MHILLASFFLIFGCTISKAPKELYSRPNWSESKEKSPLIKIKLLTTAGQMATNVPKEETYGDNNGTGVVKKFKVGGAEILASYIEIAKKRYGKNFVLLNLGPFAAPYKGEDHLIKMKQYFTKIGYDGVAVTLRDFFVFFDQQFSKLKYKKIPFINSSLAILNQQKRKKRKKRSVLPWKIKKINAVKLGILALSTHNAHKVLPHLYKGLLVQDSIAAFLRTKNLLKKKGVHIFILLTHFETKCKRLGPSFPSRPMSFSLKENLKCFETDPLFSFIKRLPPLKNMIILNWGKDLLRGFIKNIPIMQLPVSNTYLSETELVFNSRLKAIDFNLSSFSPPVKLCHEFFSETQDCFLEDLSNGRNTLIKQSNYSVGPAKYLGLLVRPSTWVQKLFKDK